MDKIGVFGGSFDPVHAGHVRASLAFQSQFNLSRVYIIPSPGAPLKHGSPALDGSARLELLRAAFAPHPVCVCDDSELALPPPVYTVDTLKRLQRRHPGARLNLLIGEDQLAQLPQWKDWRELFELAAVAVAPRRGAHPAALPDGYNARVRRIQMDPVDVSSTSIRETLAAGRDARGRVPDEALKIILEKRYYRRPAPPRAEVETALRPRLTPRLQTHCSGVASLAAELGEQYGADADWLYAAGWFHDLAKTVKLDRMRELADGSGVEVDAEERASGSLMHAPASAALLIQELHPPKEIWMAVRSHTLGNAPMTLEERILYVADYAEPNREYADSAAVRDIARRDLTEAALRTVEAKIRHLNERGEPVHPRSRLAKEWLEKQR